MSVWDQMPEGADRQTGATGKGGELPQIIVPVEEGKLGRIAVSVARTLARIMGGEIRVLGIAQQQLPERDLLNRLGLHAESVAGAVVEQITEPVPSALARVAEQPTCSMIVIGLRRRMVKGACELYPDLESMLSQTKCPALVVPVDEATAAARTGRTMQRVLLPLDGSPETAAAIRPAVDLAYAANAEVDVIHVIRPDEKPPQSPGTLSIPRYMDHPEHDWPAWTHEFLARFVKCVEACPVRPKSFVHVRTGNLVDEVLKLAEEETPSVIALAWRGSLTEGRSGETVRSVLCDAKSPVLLAKADAPVPDVWRHKHSSPSVQ